MGVSTALWNLVIAGLNLGLRKDVVLQLIHAIRFGAPNIKFNTKEEARDPSMPVNASVSGDGEQFQAVNRKEKEDEMPKVRYLLYCFPILF